MATDTQAAQTVFDADSVGFLRRHDLERHLAAVVFEGLCRHRKQVVCKDHSLPERPIELTGAKFLAVALYLRDVLRERCDGERVGFVMPPGGAGYLFNVACVLADKVPVNLNPTSGATAFSSALKRSGVEVLFTLAPVREKFPSLPWPENTVDGIPIIKNLPKATVAKYLILVSLLPKGFAAKMLGIPGKGGDREAALLFTSGSDGDPKGVPLTHRNILANIAQIDETGILPETARPLCNLPLFHSFGLTVCLWYALTKGIRTVTLPSPLDVVRNAEVIEKEQCDILIATPTFFRPYFAKVKPDSLSSVKLVVAGAEKTPAGFQERWVERFGSTYIEGYGMTEATPVVSVNLPESVRVGTVGPLFAGMKARVVDPDSREPLPLGATGILELQGPNVFPGYLDDPERTKNVFHDGWYVTGDMATIAADGYLTITGRLSRFSKIGGEMVPHATIETHLIEAFGWAQEAEPVAVVAGVEDPQRGESLVLLTTREVGLPDLREKLSSRGLPNLWIPRQVKAVPEIPVLPTGKLDLGRIRSLAAG